MSTETILKKSISQKKTTASKKITPGLKRELSLLLSWIFLMLMLGLVFDTVFECLFIALLMNAVWNLYNLNKLSQWLTKPQKQTPEVIGIWDEVYYQLYHLYKRQRSARKKLTSILSRFQKSTQALPYATIVLNEFNEIEWFNPAASQMFNLYAKVDIGQRLDNLIRQPKFSKYLQKKKFKEPVELQLNQKNIILNITAYGSGQFLVSARDITTRSKLDAMRRDFISNASHELRTPLTVMSGYVEFLQHKVNDTSAVPLERIQQQLARMNTIIAELIELARLESSDSVDYTSNIDVSALLKDVHDEILVFDNKTHKIELINNIKHAKSNSSAQLFGSYDELRMALSNLLTNAVRYTAKGGEIKLIATETETGVSISVKDNGQGIAYEHIPRLTERFYRVDEGRSKEKGGTGLGLAIVKHVLDRHNATLHVQSVVGEGSLFRCDFPTGH